MNDAASQLLPEQSARPPEGYLELYKLAVEMADRVSARRALANSFFLTTNVAIVTLLANQHFRWYMPAAGIVFALAWWALLRSYRDLNSAKFGVILEMEQKLPIGIYGDEQRRLRDGRYRELGRVERIVPWTFVVLYCIVIAT